MPKGPDPRIDVASMEELPRLLREGGAEWNARRFWHAHESWERAWHALRAAGDETRAGYVRGMILAAAALENATRGKEDGFKRQMAEGLHHVLGDPAAADALGLEQARAWERAMSALYVDACRRRDWAWWNESGWSAPPVVFA